MAFASHRLSSDRALRVERRLRARAEQLRSPGATGSPATPLGLCDACAEIVHGRDGVPMSGVYLFHPDCAPQPGRAGAA